MVPITFHALGNMAIFAIVPFPDRIHYCEGNKRLLSSVRPNRQLCKPYGQD
jgi:hypothetical protein